MRRLVTFDPGECYHVYNRGNDRHPIFIEEKNYNFFLNQLMKFLPGKAVENLVYVLMPNHYHLILRIVGHFDLSKAMKNFTISYVKAINNQYGKVGHLFQGEFKAKHVHTSEYFLHLSRYIHMNPVFAKMVKKPDQWTFSSYRGYLGTPDPFISNQNYLMSHFKNIEEYITFVEEIETQEYENIERTLEVAFR